MMKRMDGNTLIGFRHVNVKAYCTRCKKHYTYGYNGCRSADRGVSRCPVCKLNDRIETSESIDGHILMLQMCRGNIARGKQINDEIYELYRIKGEFNDQVR